MNQPFYNDQAHIAGEFQLYEDFTRETARIAFFKINSYKLSLINAAFCITREELTGIIQNSLLNYADALEILHDTHFFMAEVEN